MSNVPVPASLSLSGRMNLVWEKGDVVQVVGRNRGGALFDIQPQLLGKARIWLGNVLSFLLTCPHRLGRQDRGRGCQDFLFSLIPK
jgi:hypothetical protein